MLDLVLLYNLESAAANLLKHILHFVFQLVKLVLSFEINHFGCVTDCLEKNFLRFLDFLLNIILEIFHLVHYSRATRCSCTRFLN
jgi:hypothetical protein